MAMVATILPSPNSTLANGAKRVGWSEFLAGFDWRQGEHVTILGTTGGGKTTVMKAILPMRKYRVIFASKPRDPLMSNARKEGYEIVRHWPPHPHVEKCIFWPRISKMSDAADQRMAFYNALFDIYQRGGWCVALDETAYLARTLGLGHVLKFFYEQARSLNVSLVSLSQRPKEIPLLAYSCATHLFLFRENDDVNIKRLSEISGANSKLVKDIVRTLEKVPGKGGDFLYVNANTGEMRISKVGRG